MHLPEMSRIRTWFLSWGYQLSYGNTYYHCSSLRSLWRGTFQGCPVRTKHTCYVEKYVSIYAWTFLVSHSLHKWDRRSYRMACNSDKQQHYQGRIRVTSGFGLSHLCPPPFFTFSWTVFQYYIAKMVGENWLHYQILIATILIYIS
jgi:hypothetical protein